jgi:hypothetical protein
MLRNTSEINIKNVLTNLKKMEVIQSKPKVKKSIKKQPVKPGLTLEISEINKNFNKATDELMK